MNIVALSSGERAIRNAKPRRQSYFAKNGPARFTMLCVRRQRCYSQTAWRSAIRRKTRIQGRLRRQESENILSSRQLEYTSVDSRSKSTQRCLQVALAASAASPAASPTSPIESIVQSFSDRNNGDDGSDGKQSNIQSSRLRRKQLKTSNRLKRKHQPVCELSLDDARLVDETVQKLQTIPESESCEHALEADFMNAVISRRMSHNLPDSPSNPKQNNKYHKKIRSAMMLSRLFHTMSSCRRAHEIFSLLNREVERKNSDYLNEVHQSSSNVFDNDGEVSVNDKEPKQCTAPFYLSKDSVIVLIDKLLQNELPGQALNVCNTAKQLYENPGLQIMTYHLEACYRSFRLEECVADFKAIFKMTENEPELRRTISRSCFINAVMACVELKDCESALKIIKCAWQSGYLIDMTVGHKVMRVLLLTKHYKAVLGLVDLYLRKGSTKLQPSSLCMGLQAAMRSKDYQAIEYLADALKDGKFHKLDPKTSTAAMSAFAKVGRLDQAKSVFADMLESSKGPDLIALSTYMGSLHRVGDMDGVVDCFQLMQNQAKRVTMNDKLYAFVISAYKTLKQNEKAFDCYLHLRKEGVPLNCRIATSIMLTIHSEVMSTSHNGVVEESKAAIAFENLSMVLKDARDSNVEFDTLMYSSAMSTYAVIGQWFEAENLYKDMIVAGIRPTAEALRILLIAYWKGNQVSQAKKLFDVIIHRRPDALDRWTFEVMLTGFRNHDMFGDAEALFNLCADYVKQPSQKTMNMMIDIYRDSGQLSKALGLFKHVIKTSDVVSPYTLTAILRCCVLKGRLDTAETYWEMCLEKGVELNEGCFGVMFEVCRASQNLSRAKVYMEEMKRKNFELNVIHYSTIMSLHFEVGDIEGGREIFAEMTDQCVLDDIAFYIYTRNLVEAGLKDDAIDFVKKIDDDSLVNRIHPYHALVGSLGEAGFCDDMLEMFSHMKRIGLIPMSRTYEAAIEHCCDSGNDEAADVLIEEMQISCKEINEHQYAFLLQIFWRRQEYERMIEAYEGMNQKGLQPTYTTFLSMLRASYETGRYEMTVHIHEQMTGIGMDIDGDGEDHRRVCHAHAKVGNWMQLGSHLQALGPEFIDLFSEEDFRTFVESALRAEEYDAAYGLYHKGLKFNINFKSQLKDMMIDCARQLGQWEEALKFDREIEESDNEDERDNYDDERDVHDDERDDYDEDAMPSLVILDDP